MDNIAKKSGLFTVTVALLCGASSLRAELVYDNSVNDLGIRFVAQNGVQIGDQVTLVGTSRRLTDFSCEYFGTNFSGNEFATIRLFENNGPLFNGIANAPGSLLFDSGPMSITPTNRATVGWLWNATEPAVDVPDNFTWTIEFTGIEPGEQAGLDLYAPVALGESYGDYWQLNGANWVLLQNTNGTTVNFASRIQATVPEPSSMVLLALGGIVGAFVWNRRRLG
jgi:hypothetical protein